MAYDRLQPPAPPSAALSALGYVSVGLMLGLVAVIAVLISAGVKGNETLFWSMFGLALGLGALAIATYWLAPKCVPLPAPFEDDDDEVDAATRV